MLESVKSEDHLLACKLAEANLVNLTETELAIGFNGGMSVLADSIEKNSSVIKPILQKLTGHNLKLKILSLPNKKTRKNIDTIKEEVFAEPLVRDAMRLFNSSLVKVNPLENEEETDKQV